MAQRLARGAHNSEVRCSNHLAGIFQFAGLQEPVHAVTTATIHRDGAEEARGAHNPEVTGSNPVSGIFLYGRTHNGGLWVVKKLK